MKKLLLTTAIIGALAAPAMAQTATEIFRSEAAATDILASELIGQRVYASEAAMDGAAVQGLRDGWEDIGEVNDVILSREGEVQAVLVDIGGFLGIGERTVAIQMAALQMVSDDATSDNEGDYFLVMNANRAALEEAPMWGNAGEDAAMTGDATEGTTSATAGTATTDSAGVAEGGLSDDQPAVPVDGAGGSVVSGAGGTTTEETMTAGSEGTDATGAGTLTSGSDAVEATGTEGTGTDGASMATGDNSTDSTPGMSREGYAAMAPEALTAETLGSAEIYDQQDEQIGSVSDLVLDDSGQITEVVVDVGGFLGIGAKRVALPIAEVEILQSEGGDDVRVYVPHTREQLESMPAMEG